MNKVKFFDLTQIRIDQIGDLREGKKRNAQWQNHCGQCPCTAGQGIDIINKKVGVFEIN